MEEKDRYELIGYCFYRDTETGDIDDNFVGVLNEQDQKIKDLEAKLAESEKEKDYYQDLYFISIKGQEKLKQQLAEKEKEIEKYRDANMIVLGERIQGKKHLMQIKIKELQNQTAIRELEKVKGFLLEKIEEKQSCFDSGNYNDFADGVKTICELMLISIDKQIKELKGEK